MVGCTKGPDWKTNWCWYIYVYFFSWIANWAYPYPLDSDKSSISLMHLQDPPITEWLESSQRCTLRTTTPLFNYPSTSFLFLDIFWIYYVFWKTFFSFLLSLLTWHHMVLWSFIDRLVRLTYELSCPILWNMNQYFTSNLQETRYFFDFFPTMLITRVVLH